MKQFTEIQISSDEKYYCIVSSDYVIIDCYPENEYFLYSDIRDLFKQHKEEYTFTLLQIVEPKILIAEDMYNYMVKKNPVLEDLKEDFKLKITS